MNNLLPLGLQNVDFMNYNTMQVQILTKAQDTYVFGYDKNCIQINPCKGSWHVCHGLRKCCSEYKLFIGLGHVYLGL